MNEIGSLVVRLLDETTKTSVGLFAPGLIGTLPVGLFTSRLLRPLAVGLLAARLFCALTVMLVPYLPVFPAFLATCSPRYRTPLPL